MKQLVCPIVRVPAKKSLDAGVPSGAGASQVSGSTWPRPGLRHRRRWHRSGSHIDEVQGHLAGFDLGPQFCQPFRRQIVIDDLHIGVRRHVGVVVRLLLAGCIGAAPGRRCSDFPPGRSRPPAQRPPLLPRNSVFVSSISPLFCPCRGRRDIPVSTRFPPSFRGTYPPIPRHAGVDTQAPCNPRRPSRGESVCLHGEKHDAGRLVP